MTAPNTPELSIVVIAHNMRQQAMNTLYSLSARYQRDITPSRYEVIVVENDSADMLDAAEVLALGDNFIYQRRQETGTSPAAAINAGLALCRAPRLGLMIDGARMLSPRTLHLALEALADKDALVVVPAYYLTERGRDGGDPEAVLQHEQQLLEQLDWRKNGYRLFQHACFSNGNRHGYLDPIMECTALFTQTQRLRTAGGADERFNLRGGGALNLHLYRKLATEIEGEIYILPGEGNFHQFHGGTSTTPGEVRDRLVRAFKTQLDEFWPGGFKAVSREPLLYGPVTQHALPFLQRSAQSAEVRIKRFAERGESPWPDDKDRQDKT